MAVWRRAARTLPTQAHGGAGGYSTGKTRRDSGRWWHSDRFAQVAASPAFKPLFPTKRQSGALTVCERDASRRISAGALAPQSNESGPSILGPTPHAESYLMVHPPDYGISFGADHFEALDSGPFPMQTPNSRFITATIEQMEIEGKNHCSSAR